MASMQSRLRQGNERLSHIGCCTMSLICLKLRQCPLALLAVPAEFNLQPQTLPDLPISIWAARFAVWQLHSSIASAWQCWQGYSGWWQETEMVILCFDTSIFKPKECQACSHEYSFIVVCLDSTINVGPLCARGAGAAWSAGDRASAEFTYNPSQPQRRCRLSSQLCSTTHPVHAEHADNLDYWGAEHGGCNEEGRV